MQVITKYFYKLYLPFIAVISLLVSLHFHKESPKSVIWSDAEGYYLYLPAVFIYNGFEGLPKISGQMTEYPGSDKIYTKYTCGVAIMQMPFFLVAQGISYLLEKDTSGYSSMSNLAVRIAAVFYMLAGLILIRKVLRRHFSKAVTFLAILCIWLGTNLFYYSVREAGMSHAYSFFLFALFIWFTPLFLSKPTFKNSIWLGLLTGLIILVRPTNGILLLYLLLYEVYSFKALGARIQYFLKHTPVLLVAAIAAFIVFIPQFIYWHYISGSFIIYSYNQEGFIYWLKPKIVQVLFDVQNGWLLYSPVLIFSLVGLGMAVKQKNFSGYGILLIMMLATYIFASWWAWWFGGAFGHRCFVEFHALLAIPLAGFFTWLINSRIAFLKGSVFLLVAAMLYYNVRLTYLYVSPWDGPDWTWQKFGEVLKNL